MTEFNLLLLGNFSAEFIVTYIVGAGTFASIIIAFRRITVRRTDLGRMENLRRHTVNIHIDAPLPRREKFTGDGAAANILKIWLRYVRSLHSHQMNGLRGRLFQAGHRSKEAVAIYVCCKFSLPLITMILSFFYYMYFFH
ncbi:MAG: hypothetical protein WAS21_02590 [Geminicoccaceae bacterium]